MFEIKISCEMLFQGEIIFHDIFHILDPIEMFYFTILSESNVPYSPQNNAALYEIYSNENPRYTRVSYDIYVVITRIL